MLELIKPLFWQLWQPFSHVHQVFFCKLLKKCNQNTPSFKCFLRLQFLLSWQETLRDDRSISVNTENWILIGLGMPDTPTWQPMTSSAKTLYHESTKPDTRNARFLCISLNDSATTWQRKKMPVRSSILLPYTLWQRKCWMWATWNKPAFTRASSPVLDHLKAYIYDLNLLM